jgi:hypothetical protein
MVASEQDEDIIGPSGYGRCCSFDGRLQARRQQEKNMVEPHGR